jgi:putative membrane protein
MSRTTPITTVFAVSFALAACGSSGTNESSASDNTVTTNEVGSLDNGAGANMANTGDATMTAAPTTASEFAAAAGASDLFEITSSKMAQSQASSAKVKDFASMLVTDHTKSTAELKSIASKENITLSPPTLTADMQGKVDALKAAKGDQFDSLYLSQQIPAHETALKMHQGYAQGGDNAALKSFASKVSTVVQKHLDEARNLSK